MASRGNSRPLHKNSLADRAQRAAGREPDREKGPVSGAYGKDEHANRLGQIHELYSKSDFTTVGASRRPARKRKT